MKKILFVAMQMSTHAARWINQIADQGWDLHLFPVNHLPVIPEMRGVTVHRPFRMVHKADLIKHCSRAFGINRSKIGPPLEQLPERAIFPFPMVPQLVRAIGAAKYVRLGESDAKAPFLYGPHVLGRLVRSLKPDLIHSLEFQHCGYNVLRAKELSGGNLPPWLATNWGSDIYYFRQFDDHRRQISRLLRAIDFYSCECRRDVLLAKELGMSAHVMPVMPNTGGFNLKTMEVARQRLAPSARRVVMVKGYQHFAGRALTALKAVERCSDLLHGFKILVFSASSETAERVRQLKADSILDIELLPYSSHEEMLGHFSESRIYLGVSISDAISTSMLEAMTMGAYPIQTNTSCCDEWIVDGLSGFIIPPDDVDCIADRLRTALMDDQLVDSAATLNWQMVCKRLDQEILKKKAVAFYNEMFSILETRRVETGA